MANIHIERNHSLGLEEARTQVEIMAKNLRDDLQITYQWQGDRLVFQRSGASGTIDVGADTVAVDLKLGLALGLLKGKIEDSINRNLDQVLNS